MLVVSKMVFLRIKTGFIHVKCMSIRVGLDREKRMGTASSELSMKL
jgi:hypothetical protein